MDRLTIDRSASTDQGTPGAATLHNVAGIELWNAHSLELPWRDNASDVSCIEDGVYLAKYVFSPKFNRKVYVLQNVPHRVACELHLGNWAGDKTRGFWSDVEGCTVFGTDTAVMAKPGYPPQIAVIHSGVAYDALVAATGGADIEVEYRWTAGNEPKE